LGESGVLGDVHHLEAEFLQKSCGSSGGNDFIPQLAEFFREGAKAGLVAHTDQHPQGSCTHDSSSFQIKAGNVGTNRPTENGSADRDASRTARGMALALVR